MNMFKPTVWVPGDWNAYFGFGTNILVASVRHVGHVLESAAIGADVATLPPSVIWQLANHSLTDKGLESFMAEWNKSGQKI